MMRQPPTTVHTTCIYSSKQGYQSVLADNEQALGAINLSKPDFFIESAVASHHHGDAIWEASLWDLRRRAQDRRCQVVDLKTWLWDKRFIMKSGVGGNSVMSYWCLSLFSSKEIKMLFKSREMKFYVIGNNSVLALTNRSSLKRYETSAFSGWFPVI